LPWAKTEPLISDGVMSLSISNGKSGTFICSHHFPIIFPYVPIIIFLSKDLKSALCSSTPQRLHRSPTHWGPKTGPSAECQDGFPGPCHTWPRNYHRSQWGGCGTYRSVIHGNPI
jgi:hypothetical protein